MVVVTVAWQRAVVCGQPGSPPPLTVAVLTAWPVAIGVTGMTKVAAAPDANPVGIVHVTLFPAAPQPGGIGPGVTDPGSASVTVTVDVVASGPLLTTVIA